MNQQRNVTIDPWRFADKQKELMAIYQQILDWAARCGLYKIMDDVAQDVQRDIEEGFFLDRETGKTRR